MQRTNELQKPDTTSPLRKQLTRGFIYATVGYCLSIWAAVALTYVVPAGHAAMVWTYLQATCSPFGVKVMTGMGAITCVLGLLQAFAGYQAKQAKAVAATTTAGNERRSA